MSPDLPNPATHREARADWMQEIAPFAILTTDARLHINSWNQWLATPSGLDADAVLGRHLFEVFPDLKARKLDDYFQRALGGEVSVLSTALHQYLLPLPNTVRGSSDRYMQQTARVAPLYSGTTVLGTITIIEDVSQREFQAGLLRRQHSREQLLSWALGHLLQSSDPLRDVAALFPKVSAEFQLEGHFNCLPDLPEGPSPPAARGERPPAPKPAIDLLPAAAVLGDLCAGHRTPVLVNRIQEGSDPSAAAARALGARAFAGFPLLVGDRLLGTLSFASFHRDTIAPAEFEFLSTLAQYVAVALDRATREATLRETQAILREHAESLEAKVALRTERLHETISQLESFSYSVAHDLRAPIRALKGYCEILLEEHAAVLPADGRDVLGKLLRASDRLDILTRDLLRFSKLAMQPVELAPVDLAELVSDIVLLTPALTEDVLVIHGPLGRVLGQRTLLQQCLSNLFDNSLKFVRANQKPRIVVRSELMAEAAPAADSATAAPFNPATHPSTDPFGGRSTPPVPAGQRLRLWIEDNGIGIAPEFHQKIFGIVERGIGSSAIEGTGIGLAIVARAMQQMGGLCGVESTPGSGSRFWLELRLA
jgi:PAS domain S-box-containing protein